MASAQFITMLPDYADEFAGVVDQLVAALGSLGFHPETAAGAFSWLTPEVLISAAYSVADSVLGLATAFFFVLAYVIFMAADAAALGRRGQAFAPRPAVIATRYFSGVRRYYVVNASFGLRRRDHRRTHPVGARHPRSDRLGRAGIRDELHPQHRLRDRRDPAGDLRPGDRWLAARARSSSPRTAL